MSFRQIYGRVQPAVLFIAKISIVAALLGAILFFFNNWTFFEYKQLHEIYLKLLWAGLDFVIKVVLYCAICLLSFILFFKKYQIYSELQPILGFILGAVIYFITAAGFLIVDFSTGRTTGDSTLISPVVVALQVVLGWISGFRQRVVLEMVEKIIRRLLGKSEDTDETEEPESSTPVGVAETIQPPPGET